MMPLRTARRGDTVSYRNAVGQTFNGLVIGDTKAPATAPGSSTSASGGTLAAGTYSYRITFRYGTLETAPSPAKSQVTTGSTSTVTVDLTGYPIPQGATSWRVYGRSAGTELLMGTVTLPTLQFVDDASVTPAGALTTDTGNAGLLLYSQPNIVSAPKATTVKSVSSYFNRY